MLAPNRRQQPRKRSSPARIRTVVKGSKALYPWPLDDGAAKRTRLPWIYKDCCGNRGTLTRAS